MTTPNQNQIPLPDVIPTGFAALDEALGVGGLPCGHIVELIAPAGDDSAVRLAAQLINANAGQVMAIGPDEWQARLRTPGLNACTVVCPDPAHETLDRVERVSRAALAGGTPFWGVKLVVVDTASAAVPPPDVHPGLHARLASQAMRKLCAVVARTQCCVVFVSTAPAHGERGTAIGTALRFSASIRVAVKTQTKWGHVVHAHVVKNKLAPPFRECDLVFLTRAGEDAITAASAAREREYLCKRAGCDLAPPGESGDVHVAGCPNAPREANTAPESATFRAVVSRLCRNAVDRGAVEEVVGPALRTILRAARMYDVGRDDLLNLVEQAWNATASELRHDSRAPIAEPLLVDEEQAGCPECDDGTRCEADSERLRANITILSVRLDRSLRISIACEAHGVTRETCRAALAGDEDAIERCQRAIRAAEGV